MQQQIIMNNSVENRQVQEDRCHRERAITTILKMYQTLPQPKGRSLLGRRPLLQHAGGAGYSPGNEPISKRNPAGLAVVRYKADLIIDSDRNMTMIVDASRYRH